MLVSFSVRNYRSFRDEATLDLRTSGGTAAGASPWDGNLQPVAGIYGANASGKTTFFNAISAMVQQVLESYRSQRLLGEPFAFDNTSDAQPTKWSATFIATDGICYAYGFSVLNHTVVEEWAERYTTARPTLLFERKGSTIRYGTALKGANRAVERTLRPSALYLSAAAAAGHEGLMPLYDWFHQRLQVFEAGGHRSQLSKVIMILAQEPERQERLATMMLRADLGLSGFELEKRDLSDAQRHQMQKVAEAMQMMTGQELSPQMLNESYEVFGTHNVAGQGFRLPFNLESDGTRAMLCHAFVIDDVLRTGSTAVFDEIDASLHPLLVRQLVRVFQDQQLNPLQAQMIFTTHDVSLMDAGYGNGAQLGREEIWLTEKNPVGCSTLVPLADYAPRTRENLARRYMSGRYGGIPEQIDLVDPVLV